MANVRSYFLHKHINHSPRLQDLFWQTIPNIGLSFNLFSAFLWLPVHQLHRAYLVQENWETTTTWFMVLSQLSQNPSLFKILFSQYSLSRIQTDLWSLSLTTSVTSHRQLEHQQVLTLLSAMCFSSESVTFISVATTWNRLCSCHPRLRHSSLLELFSLLVYQSLFFDTCWELPKSLTIKREAQITAHSPSLLSSHLHLGEIPSLSLVYLSFASHCAWLCKLQSSSPCFILRIVSRWDQVLDLLLTLIVTIFLCNIRAEILSCLRLNPEGPGLLCGNWQEFVE